MPISEPIEDVLLRKYLEAKRADGQLSPAPEPRAACCACDDTSVIRYEANGVTYSLCRKHHMAFAAGEIDLYQLCFGDGL